MMAWPLIEHNTISDHNACPVTFIVLTTIQPYLVQIGIMHVNSVT
jgi:hypothetical protein